MTSTGSLSGLTRDAATFLLLLGCVMAVSAQFAYAQEDDVKPIVRPARLESKEQIEKFVLQVLSDRTKRDDPFVKTRSKQERTVVRYRVLPRPRPRSGLGRYDITDLTLIAIWKESQKVVAMVSSPDEKQFIIKIGDEAYDGRLVEINPGSRSIKFLQELRREGPSVRGQPDVKYVEKEIHLRR